AMAAGVLIKGPLIAVFVGLTAASLAVIERSVAFLKARRPATGTLVCLPPRRTHITASLGLPMVAGAAWFAHDGASWQFLGIVLVAIAALGLGWRTTLAGLAGNDRARFAAGLISSTIA